MSFPRYPAYKPSGVEWLGEVPEHWNRTALKFLADYQNGYPFKPEDRGTEGLPIIRISQLTGNDEPAYYSGDLDERVKVRDGDLLFTWSATIDSFIWDKGEAWLNQHIFRVSPSAEADKRYLYYVIKHVAPKLADFDAHGSTMRHIKKESLGEKVYVPSVRDQALIATFLDHETAKIDALIAEQQRLIELLQEKRQAVISHAVTKGLNPHAPMKDSGVEWLGEVPEHWEVGPVKRFLASMNHKRIPLSSEERSTRQGEYPYYGASGVIDSVDEFLFEESLVLVSEDGANLLMRSTPIAFVASGKYWVNNHAHILKPIDGMPAFWSEMIESLQLAPFVTGSAQPKLTAEALMNLMVTSPPEEAEKSGIQKRIQEAMAEFDPLLDASRNSIALLQERRSALISAAVTGQIDVRGLVPEAEAV